MIKTLVALLIKNWLVVILLLLCGWMGLCLFLEKRSHVSDLTKVQVQAAKDVGAATGQVVSQKKINADLSGNLRDALAKLQLAGAHVVEHGSNVVTIHDSTPGSFTGTPCTQVATATGAPAPYSWNDEYHRFHLDLPSGLFTRNQKFAFDLAVLRGVDGKLTYSKADLREYDPVTGVEIPNTGVAVAGQFELTQEATAEAVASTFHPIVIAGVNGKGAFGGGVEFFRVWRLGVAGMIYYQDHAISPQVQLGYHLNLGFLKTNLSVGLAYAPIGGTVYPAAGMELTK